MELMIMYIGWHWWARSRKHSNVPRPFQGGVCGREYNMIYGLSMCSIVEWAWSFVLPSASLLSMYEFYMVFSIKVVGICCWQDCWGKVEVKMVGNGTVLDLCATIVGASRSEPHTNHVYKKVAVPMYVCMYVCIYVVLRHGPHSTWIACMHHMHQDSTCQVLEHSSFIIMFEKHTNNIDA